MKNKKLVMTLVLVAAVAVVGTNLYLAKKTKHKKRLAVISDAGYETAHDIHFPLKYRKWR